METSLVTLVVRISFECLMMKYGPEKDLGVEMESPPLVASLKDVGNNTERGGESVLSSQ